MRAPEPGFWTSGSGGRIQCLLCPRACNIQRGSSGHCGARANPDGHLALPLYGHVSSIALDPIEKKPLRLFLPGTRTFSAGFWGCNLDCPFCQNHEISHPAPHPAGSRPSGPSGWTLTPGELVGMALDSGAPSISYTYSEPCIHVEFVRECMERAHASGLLNVLVTNGCILAPPARHILEYCDAANIDLKTGSASIYREMLGGDLATVKEFIGMAVSMRCHVEVTTLAVPGISDDREGIARIAEFLAGLAPVPPLHITPYHPDHLMRAPPLTRARYDSLVAEAEKTLARVFSY